MIFVGWLISLALLVGYLFMPIESRDTGIIIASSVFSVAGSLGAIAARIAQKK